MRVIIEKPELEPFIENRVRSWSPTVQYLSQTEVHVYALAIAASVLLSFFPFLIVMMTLLRDVLHFRAARPRSSSRCTIISPARWQLRLRKT